MLMINKIISFVIMLSVVFSQYWQPFHPQDLINHRNEIIDFEAIDNAARLREVEFIDRSVLTHEIIGYLPYWEYNHYPDLDYSLLTQLNFFSAELDSYGNIINDHNWNNLYIVDYAHERGVKIKLCATLFGESELTALLSNPDNRQNAIANLLERVISKNADGVDIDFELLPNNQRDNLVLFMEELSEVFHENMEDPIITMATPAIDWSDAWDYNRLAQITDGLFIMGYNYFYGGSNIAGPVSPLGAYYYDLEYTMYDYISKTNNQLDKLILGLPYYGYDWPVQNNSQNSETIGYGVAKIYSQAELMSDIYGYNYNQDSHAPWFSYNYDNSWYQCWYDDSLSLANKYDYIKNLNIQGAGIWALGYDDGHDELWGAIYEKFTGSLIGDLNFDNQVNIFDIILLVSNILEDDNFYNASVDFNSDDIINIVDVIALVAIVLD
jgi:spore germination protein